MIGQILLLILCYVVAIGLAARIILFRKTGNKSYRHDYSALINTLTARPGKHEKQYKSIFNKEGSIK